MHIFDSDFVVVVLPAELFQRVGGSRPEIPDQKRSTHSSVRGKVFLFFFFLTLSFFHCCCCCDDLDCEFGDIFRKFVESDKYTRFCQWKNLELNIQVLKAYVIERYSSRYLQGSRECVYVYKKAITDGRTLPSFGPSGAASGAESFKLVVQVLSAGVGRRQTSACAL